jgi:hypothetical protein
MHLRTKQGCRVAWCKSDQAATLLTVTFTTPEQSRQARKRSVAIATKPF